MKIKNLSSSYLNVTLIVIASLLFAGACYQWPLFSGNQNGYFLKGMTNAGYGFLSSDWLAKCTDQIPVFSAMVTFIHIHSGDWMFYVIYGILAAIYFLSIYAIVIKVFPGISQMVSMSLFFIMITIVHCMWLGDWLSEIFPGLSKIFHFFQSLIVSITSGFAMQMVLGPILQPSAFGVLLVASIALFIHKKEFFAIICAVLAATIHPTYILHAAMLVGCYVIFLLSEKKSRKSLKIGVLAVILILPILFYLRAALHPTNSVVFAQAQTLLVEQQIPFHTKISVWFDTSAYIEAIIIIIGLILMYRCKPLFIVLTICTVVMITLTCIQVFSGSNSLALLFPWRISVCLVPISTSLILALVSVKAANLIENIKQQRYRQFVQSFAVILSAALLIAIFALGLQQTVANSHHHFDKTPVINFAKQHAASGQTYLIPVKFQDFRLNVGVPVFIDSMSHPFVDVQILEWNRRVQLAQAFYQAKDIDSAKKALAEIQKQAKITHILMEKGGLDLHELNNARLVYNGPDAAVYQLLN